MPRQPTTLPKPANDPVKDKPVRRYFLLVTGQVIFRMPDSETPMTASLNTLAQSADGRIPLFIIGRAQQALQAQLQKNIGLETKITFVDVVILNIVNLGLFSEEEFRASPAGLQQVEVPQGKPS